MTKSSMIIRSNLVFIKSIVIAMKDKWHDRLSFPAKKCSRPKSVWAAADDISEADMDIIATEIVCTFVYIKEYQHNMGCLGLYLTFNK